MHRPINTVCPWEVSAQTKHRYRQCFRWHSHCWSELPCIYTSCSDHIEYALFPQTNAAHFCCTPQWHSVFYEVIWFRLICSNRSAYRFILLLDLFHPTAFAISIPDSWTKTGFFNHLRCDLYSYRDSFHIPICKNDRHYKSQLQLSCKKQVVFYQISCFCQLLGIN